MLAQLEQNIDFMPHIVTRGFCLKNILNKETTDEEINKQS